MAGELAVIDVGNGLKVEVHCVLYGHNREHDQGVRYEPPFDTLPSAIDWIEQRCHALEEQCDDDP